jgi:protein-tyrosine phosphatase
MGNLAALHRIGVQAIVSLADWYELLWDPSEQALVQETIERSFVHHLFPLGNATAPSRQVVRTILNTIDHLSASNFWRIYVHCVNGRGRTGVIAGCWLARHGYGTGVEALAALQALRFTAGLNDQSPETPEQRAFVTSWKTKE